MNEATREFVRERAGDRCEYCQLHQEHLPFAPFHLEHIIPRKHGGNDDPANLALACFHCNSHKGPNLSGIDPVSGDVVALFHPRRQAWGQHFAFLNFEVIGLTPTGRATAQVLEMNAPDRIKLRQELKSRGTLA
jgi:hypothetical protein